MKIASTSALSFHRFAGCAGLWLLGLSLAMAEPAPPPACRLSWTETKPVARGGWGRMIRLANGAWLAVSTRFSRHQSTRQLLLSNDAARTWINLAEVSEAGRLLDNGDLILTRGGALLLTGRSLVAGASYQLPVYRSADNGNNSCSNTLSCSDDFGRTWQAAEPPAWNVGSGKNFTWPAIYQTGGNEVASMVSWHGVQLRFGAISGGKPSTAAKP